MQRPTLTVALLWALMVQSGTAAAAAAGTVADTVPAEKDAAADGSPDRPPHPWMSQIHYVRLPFGLDEPSLLVCTREDWQHYQDSNGPGRTPVEPPCNLDEKMLVAWRARSGVSGCVPPAAGIKDIREQSDRISIEFYSGGSMGDCAAYYRPTVAACLPRAEKRIEIGPRPPDYVYLPDGKLFELAPEESTQKSQCSASPTDQTNQPVSREERKL